MNLANDDAELFAAIGEKTDKVYIYMNIIKENKERLLDVVSKEEFSTYYMFVDDDSQY